MFKNLSPHSTTASDADLQLLAAWANSDLPPDYLSFLKATNGGDTNPDLPEYFRFWSPSDVISHNNGYQVRENLPGFIGIGDDGGPSIFLINITTLEIFRYPFSLDQYYAQCVARDFSALIDHIESLLPDA